MAEPPVTLAVPLRQLHTGVRLAQEELVEATSVSPQSIRTWNIYAETTP